MALQAGLLHLLLCSLVDSFHASRISTSKLEAVLEHIDHHSKISEDLANSSRETFPALRESSDVEVVLIRHGQSFWNLHEIKCFSLGKVSGTKTSKVTNMFATNLTGKREACKDACLTGKGVAQAVNLQQFIHAYVGNKEPSKVQLAGSGLSRAWDTLILATKSLRQTGQYCNVHMVPSLMEFGNIDTKRKGERNDYDAVHMADSICGPKAKEAAIDRKIEEDLREACIREADKFWEKYYAMGSTTPRGNITMPGEWVEVKKEYPRRRDNIDLQIRALLCYLVDQSVLFEKEVILAGTHSNLIREAAKAWLNGKSGKQFEGVVHRKEMRTNQGIYFLRDEETKYNVKTEKLPNGGILKLKLRITPCVNCNECPGRHVEKHTTSNVVVNDQCVEFLTPEVMEVAT